MTDSAALGVDDRIELLALAQRQFTTDLQSLGAKVDENHERAMAYAQQVQANVTLVEKTVVSEGARLDSRLGQLKSTLGEVKEHVEFLTGRLDTVATGLTARIDAVETALTGRIDTLDTKMDALETKVDGLETKVDGLETKVDALDTKVDALETKVDSLDGKLDELLRRSEPGEKIGAEG